MINCILLFLISTALKSDAWVYIGRNDRRNSCRVRLSDFGNQLTVDEEGVSVFLQFLWDDDEYLCSANSTSFFTETDANDPKYHGVLDLIPFGLVARDGMCSLPQKIANAEAMGVSFLVMASHSVVFTNKLPAPEANFSTSLTVITISSDCGDDMTGQMGFDKSSLDNEWLDDGDFENLLLSQVSYLYNVGPDFQEDMMYPVGGLLAFGLLYCLIIAPLCHTFDPSFRRRRISPSHPSTASRNLLTEDFVDGLSCDRAARELIENSHEPPSCSVCLDAFDVTSKVTVLPCGHHYHHNCIRPWLTQRQSKCPLCKFDLMPPKHQESCNDSGPHRWPASWLTLRDRLTDTAVATFHWIRRVVESNRGEIQVISWPAEDHEGHHELELTVAPIDGVPAESQPTR